MRKLLGIILLLLAALPLWAGEPASSPDPILEYIQARAQQDKTPYTVDVTITASIPSLGKMGTFHATRRQGPNGKFTYEAINFEGDRLIKTNVIARYLTAEIEAQKPEEKMATQISPANYQFKLKSHEFVDGHEVLVYQVKPLKKRPGLFQGQIWIDAVTRQPIQEAGKLAKLPSIWLKEISFKREYTTAQGFAVPARIISDIKTRIVGKAKVTVQFSNYRVPDTTMSASENGGGNGSSMGNSAGNEQQ